MKKNAYWIPVVETDKQNHCYGLNYEEWWSPQYRCSNCGNVTLDNGRFCSQCGLPMTGKASVIRLNGKNYYYSLCDEEQIGVFWPCKETDKPNGGEEDA